MKLIEAKKAKNMLFLALLIWSETGAPWAIVSSVDTGTSAASRWTDQGVGRKSFFLLRYLYSAQYFLKSAFSRANRL